MYCVKLHTHETHVGPGRVSIVKTRHRVALIIHSIGSQKTLDEEMTVSRGDDDLSAGGLGNLVLEELEERMGDAIL